MNNLTFRRLLFRTTNLFIIPKRNFYFQHHSHGAGDVSDYNIYNSSCI